MEKAKNLGIDFFTEVPTKNPQEIFLEAGKILYNDYIKYKRGKAFEKETFEKKAFEKLNKYINF